MIRHIIPQGTDSVITLGSELVYSQRKEWCGATWRPLRLSFMRSRQYFYYDAPETLPLLVFFCGGGYTTVDHNVWTPELAWYAKRGWAVASVEYSVTARTKFPEPLEDCKQAIRYLRAHAQTLGIDPQRVVVMGESAGAYMCGLVALTGEDRQHDRGDFLDQSSAVRGAVAFYPPVTPASSNLMDDRRALLPDLPPLARESTPPFLLLHGTKDSQVDLQQSELLYQALQEKGVASDLYILDGAEHADAPFYQEEVKQIILDFMNRCVE